LIRGWQICNGGGNAALGAAAGNVVHAQ
jgi:hypothetical protein